MATYGDKFYERDSSTRLPAEIVLAHAVELFATPFESVFDVGCGVGTWLSVAKKLGAHHVQGVEGPWLQGSRRIVVEPSEISFQNLNEPIKAGKVPYDLVVSIEVAEHLLPSRSASFVKELCEFAPVVLFSAAIPGQGGTAHINERFQDFWARLFKQNGYWCSVALRQKIWDDDRLPYFLRQNILLFARRDIAEKIPSFRPTQPCLSVVHPDLAISWHPRIVTSLQWLYVSLLRKMDRFIRFPSKYRTEIC